MAHIPLSGSQYTSRSLAASCQSAVNLILEPIEVAIVPAANVGTAVEGKGRSVMYGAPGRHLLQSLAKSKGLWAGGGRLFSSDGLALTEVGQDGSIVSTHVYATPYSLGPNYTNPATDPNPSTSTPSSEARPATAPSIAMR